MSDAKWQSIARKGADLLRKNGIFLDNVERKIALVEADGAKVIGAAAFYTSSFRNGTVTYSFDLAVDERYRGKGVGRALLDGVLRIIDQASRFTTEPHVRVDVNVVNAPPYWRPCAAAGSSSSTCPVSTSGMR